ncbi:hypothetical protein ACQJBY_036444 [Aegilops geniculata]
MASAMSLHACPPPHSHKGLQVCARESCGCGGPILLVGLGARWGGALARTLAAIQGQSCAARQHGVRRGWELLVDWRAGLSTWSSALHAEADSCSSAWARGGLGAPRRPRRSAG